MQNNVPDASALSSGKVTPENVSALETRLAALEAQLESKGLGWEEDYRNLLMQEVRQRIDNKQIALLVSGCVLAFMAVLACIGISHAGIGTITPSVAVAAIVVPLGSITVVTAVILSGAFRSFKDADADKINVASIAAEGAKSFASK